MVRLRLLLLLHYLLVVRAGAARPEQPSPRVFAYVHSAACQVRNAWRGGLCYDSCNGVQPSATALNLAAPPVLRRPQPAPASKRAHYRAEQARYHARCRAAMGF